MPTFNRLGMDESSKEVAGDGAPDREDGMALSVEKAGPATPRIEFDALDSAGSLTGITIGHYLVGPRLGGGAMATVYRAQDQILDRSVAIKVLMPGADAVMQARFRREARTVSTLVHPHIVRTLQVGRSGGIIYIAMELVEGASLGDLLERHGKLSVADAGQLLAPVAQALAYAHTQGIIHRDVKPSNILLQRAEPGAANSVVTGVLPFPVIPLLSDFGIARALDAPELTNAGRTIGTPAFMAPEQCAGSADIDGRADVYALGAVLYRCLVGRPPFAGTTTQILHAHVYDPLLIPESVAEILPAPVVRIMARAMMKEPSQRYATVDLMANELQALADLPELPASDASADLIDPTMTMASLPVAQSPATSTSRVLVPAAPIVAIPRSPLKPVPRAQGAITARAIPIAPPPTARTRSRSSRWGMVALGGTVDLVVVLIAMLINNMMSGFGENEPTAREEATATPAAVAEVGTPQVPVVIAPSGTETVVAPSETEVDSGVSPSQAISPTAQATVTDTEAISTTLPPLAVELESAWDDAQFFFDEGDWKAAQTWLEIVQRTINEKDSLFEAEIDNQRLNEMLIISYLGLAMDAAKQARWEVAIEYLDKALEVAPDVADPMIFSMRNYIEGLAALQGSSESTADEERQAAREALAATFGRYADQLERDDKVCEAAFQIDNALRIFDSEELQNRRDELRASCAAQKANESIIETGGSILYSSVDGGAYRIFSFAITSDNLAKMYSQPLVNNGAQPQLSPDRSMLAYYSPQQGNDGLFLILMEAGQALNSNPLRISPAPEASRDSPPSWGPSSNQLIYSAKFNNAPDQLFIISPAANQSVPSFVDGKDPAWHPVQNIVAFNGYDESGANPGLWTIQTNGEARRQLTRIGSDQRPTWSPDGKYLVFMSKDRPGANNWDLFRFDYATGNILQLTDAASQDGLPSVSPDGKWVAFMSDSGGRWNLWYVSIDGGAAQQLATISGQPIAWLEHGIQWVE